MSARIGKSCLAFSIASHQTMSCSSLFDAHCSSVDIHPDEFYARLAMAPDLPTTSQPPPADFLAAYEELGAYERILSLQISATFSGTFASAQAAAESLGDGRVRVVDTRTVSAAITLLALAIQRRLERGTTDEEVDALIARYTGEHGMLFTVDTLEYLAKGGRVGRAAAFAWRVARCLPPRMRRPAG